MIGGTLTTSFINTINMSSTKASDLELLAVVDILPRTTHQLTTDKKYERLLKYHNVTSYSQLLKLHECPRKFQLAKYQAAGGVPSLESGGNVHFAFGHAVGSGVQNFLLTRDLTQAAWNSFLAWKIDFNATIATKKKSIWDAYTAVEKFTEWDGLDEWELWHTPAGKPALELSFSIHAAPYKHYGHIDAILRHKNTGHLAVLELKTEGSEEPDEAKYLNSSQGIGYGVFLDALCPGVTSYVVLYAVYSTVKRNWALLPFEKTTAQKMEWIKDLMLDHSAMSTYRQIKFFPKRGESCFSFYRRCEFLHECNLVPDEELPMLPESEEAEEPDAIIDLDQLIKAQLERLHEN